MKESKQQTHYRRKNKSTPRGIIICQNGCCSFLTSWHTQGYKGEFRDHLESFKIGFWYLRQHTPRTNTATNPSTVCEWNLNSICNLIWLLLPIIASILKNSWQAPRQNAHSGQQEGGLSLIFKIIVFYLAFAAIYSNHHKSAHGPGTAPKQQNKPSAR